MAGTGARGAVGFWLMDLAWEEELEMVEARRSCRVVKGWGTCSDVDMLRIRWSHATMKVSFARREQACSERSGPWRRHRPQLYSAVHCNKLSVPCCGFCPPTCVSSSSGISGRSAEERTVTPPVDDRMFCSGCSTPAHQHISCANRFAGTA